MSLLELVVSEWRRTSVPRVSLLMTVRDGSDPLLDDELEGRTDLASLEATVPAAGLALADFVDEVPSGHTHTKCNRVQSPHVGLTSSHFFRRLRHLRHPVFALSGAR